ncbi:hypothetical protein BZG36_01378 [Bifiguratus adelaidae]|uniref:AP complex subunit sigma n=1 Tax=Bifiguratus adelaidae TaxID=1938954 RepID=A0A261Y3A6_9FUNG|nr:hypothetical protein BZG36_01378 [Bifiguratus adelaidae]
MLHFVLFLNKQLQTRFARYYDSHMDLEERPAFEQQLALLCARRKAQASFFLDYEDYRIAYRPYGGLYVIFGFDRHENEFGMLELIQNFMEVLNKHFDNVTELDVIFNHMRIHLILDEMILDGTIVETSQSRILAPVVAREHERASKREARVM